MWFIYVRQRLTTKEDKNNIKNFFYSASVSEILVIYM